MSIAAGLAIFAIIWWLVLFIVLPFGVESQSDIETTDLGMAPSAPAKPNIGRKLLLTTGGAVVVWIFVYWLIVFSGLTLTDIPFLPTFDESY